MGRQRLKGPAREKERRRESGNERERERKKERSGPRLPWGDDRKREGMVKESCVTLDQMGSPNLEPLPRRRAMRKQHRTQLKPCYRLSPKKIKENPCYRQGV